MNSNIDDPIKAKIGFSYKTQLQGISLDKYGWRNRSFDQSLGFSLFICIMLIRMRRKAVQLPNGNVLMKLEFCSRTNPK